MSPSTITSADYLRALEHGDLGLAEWYGQQLDEPVERARSWVERLDALAASARHYVSRYRLRVLPLAPGRKVPLGDRPLGRAGCCGGSHARGCLDATTDLAVVACWWTAHPTANVGIATGHRVDVLDQDGPEGALAWARLPRWPEVLGIVTTPREGGVHRYLAATGDGNGTRLAPGIDYRGRGGYVVAPPSIVDGRRYAWAQPLTLP